MTHEHNVVFGDEAKSRAPMLCKLFGSTLPVLRARWYGVWEVNEKFVLLYIPTAQYCGTFDTLSNAVAVLFYRHDGNLDGQPHRVFVGGPDPYGAEDIPYSGPPAHHRLMGGCGK